MEMNMRVHISIPTDNLAASVAFYRQVFGTDASKIREDYANFRLHTPPIHLALVHSAATTQAASTGHFGIELPDHEMLEQWRSRANDLELEVLNDPDASCCYARGDKFWLSDPNGYRWEFWVRTGESDQLKQVERVCC
jgi:catechol 2,3-dioxygenase-like lactoylglutathione lyase family enzyme